MGDETQIALVTVVVSGALRYLSYVQGHGEALKAVLVKNSSMYVHMKNTDLPGPS